MKSIQSLLLLATVGLLFSACTGPRYASSVEYDDAYFSRADIADPVAVEKPRQQERAEEYASSPRTYRQPVDSYQDAYYDEDDFTFSRRMRRFNQSSAQSWRYYDPFYANDLYYVMGTPSWNRWNNNGWYNWNQPRFGASIGWNDPFYNPYAGWGAFNSGINRNSFYYDPWVASYYGYGATPFNNPYSGFGVGSGFYGGGFNNPYGAYYCPPTGFVSSPAGWRRANNAQQSYVTRRRTTTQSATSPQNGTAVRQSVNNTRPGSTSRVSSSSNYLTPRARTATAATNRTSAPTGRTSTVRNSRTNSSRATQPSSTTTISPSRTSTSRTTTPPRTYTRPSSNSSSGSSSGSFNRSGSNSSNSSGSFNRSGSTNSGRSSSSGSTSTNSSRNSSGVRRR